MSVDVFPDVLYLEMKAGRKLVMAVLADHANEIGECWPSQALLGFRASISVPKLRDHLKELEKDDWLRTYIGAGPRGVNVYALNLSKISQASANERHRIKEEKGSHRRDITDCQVGTPDFSDTPPDSEDLPPDFRPSSPDSQDTPPGLRSPTEPSRNRQEPSIEPQKESTADFPQIQEILYTPEGSIATEKTGYGGQGMGSGLG